MHPSHHGQQHLRHNTHWIFDLSSGYGISYIILVILAIIYFIIMFILTIRAFYSKSSQGHKINNPIRIISTIQCISYLLSYLFIGIIFCFPINSKYYIIFFIIYCSLFSIGHLSFYIFMLLRVYYSFVDTKFHGSIYTISVKMIYCHCFILFIDVILYICIYYLWYTTEYINIFIVLSIIAGIFLLFSIFHFIYTFNSKLLLFTINLSNPTQQPPPPPINTQSTNTTTINTTNIDIILNNNNSNNNQRERNQSSFSQKQRALIEAITKQTLLSCFTLFIIIFLIIISIILYCIHRYSNISIFDKTETITNIFRWFLLIERCTEITSIYLSFIMNDNLYKCLCKKCHKSFQHQCHQLATKKIIKNLLIKQSLNGSSSNYTFNQQNANNNNSDLIIIPQNNPNMKETLKSNSSIELQTKNNKEMIINNHHIMNNNNNNNNNNDENKNNEDSFLNPADLPTTDDEVDEIKDNYDDDDEDDDNIGNLPQINQMTTNTDKKRNSGTTTTTTTTTSISINHTETPSTQQILLMRNMINHSQNESDSTLTATTFNGINTPQKSITKED